jgi:lipoic acid synthetase
VRAVVDAGPEVLNHNLETVPRLYPDVRPGADYGSSLDLLRRAKECAPGTLTKSGLMVGLGETREEMLEVMTDLRAAACGLLTIGQYLQPSPEHRPVIRYVPPEEMADYEDIGRRMGFQGVASAPLVRSSFDAARLFAAATDDARPSGGE